MVAVGSFTQMLHVECESRRSFFYLPGTKPAMRRLELAFHFSYGQSLSRQEVLDLFHCIFPSMKDAGP